MRVRMGSKNPSRGAPIGITRLTEWWQTVIARDRYFYPIFAWIIGYFSCSPLNTLFYHGNKTWKKGFKKSWIRWDATWWHHFIIAMTSRNDVRPTFVFYLSLGFVRVCKINRIHHWCSVGTEKSQPEGPPFQWETRLAEFPTERWTRGLGFFWNHWAPMIDSFSHIPWPYGTVLCNICWWRHWDRCLQSMTRAV